jgi:hypothetical protein
MKYKIPRRRPASLLAVAVATLAIISCVDSTFKPRQVANVDGCKVSPTFEMAPELRGSEPLKAKDGTYSLGPWHTSDGVIELKIVVLRGKRTDSFFTLNGKRLKEATGQVPQNVLECAKKLAAVQQPTLFELAMDSLVQPAQASCGDCPDGVVFIEATRADGSRVVYGFCRGHRWPCNSARV